MVRIYVYCSYNFSPVGFRLGTINCTPEIGEKAELEKDYINDYIRKALEFGFVRESFGRVPKSNNYYVLIKDLRHISGQQTGMGSELYMNFAFEFDFAEEFKNFSHNILDLYDTESGKKELADKLAEQIYPDAENVDFALGIYGRGLYGMIKDLKTPKPDYTDPKRYDFRNGTCYILNSVLNGEEKLRMLFCEDDKDIDIILKDREKKLYLVKQNKK